VAPPSPYVELPTPAGTRRTTPNAEFVGALAATDTLPRIAVGTSYPVDGRPAATVWTWEPGAPATTTALPGGGGVTSVYAGPSGTTYLLGYADLDTPKVWSSTDRVEWTSQEYTIDEGGMYAGADFGLLEVGADMMHFGSNETELYAVRIVGGTPQAKVKIADKARPGQVRWSGSATNGSTIVVITGDGDYVSPDGGATWLPVTIEQGGAESWNTQNVFWIGDRFIAIGGLLDGTRPNLQAWLSADGVTWARENIAMDDGNSDFTAQFVAASDGATVWVLRQLYNDSGDPMVVSTRDPSGAWTNPVIFPDNLVNGSRELIRPTVFHASASEALALLPPTISILGPQSARRLVAGQVQPDDVLIADEGFVSGTAAFSVGGEIGVVANGRIGGSFEQLTRSHTIFTTTDRNAWTTASEEQVLSRGSTALLPGYASDGTTTLRATIDGVQRRGPGDVEWQPTGQFGTPRRLPSLWLIENDGAVSTSADGITWSAPLPTGGETHCQLPDGRLIGPTTGTGGNFGRTVIATLETGVVETLDVRAGAECVTTPAGVIYTGVGDITITTDGATLSPLATPPKFGRYNGEAALTGVYAFGQAAMGDGAGISFTSDGVAWVDVAFPKRFDTLDSITPTADGWVAVVEDKNGFTVLYLPRQ
jgi:hypothetical protein